MADVKQCLKCAGRPVAFWDMQFPSSHRDKILSLFEPDVAVALIEFGKRLAKIDCDIVVFLARKSLCLYDILVSLGIPPVNAVLVSDRVLDMDLRPFFKKRVALIDDTLIVGTSVAKIAETLQKDANAIVQTHVFCVDRRWCCPDLVQPDTISLDLPDERVMTFCTAEVRAMSILPRPYLVDFPLTNWVSLTQKEMSYLTSSVDWFSAQITTPLQKDNDIAAISFFPTSSVLAAIRKCLGQSLFDLLAIVKVRAFSRRDNDDYHVRFVPIVTLNPVHEDTLRKVFDVMAGQIEKFKETRLSLLLEACASPTSKLRLIQFMLSVAVCKMFVSSFGTTCSHAVDFSFDIEETKRHFGPWFERELGVVTEASNLEAFSSIASAFSGSLSAQIPDEVVSWAAQTIGFDSERKQVKTHQPRDKAISLLADFTDIFRRMYDVREVPAREEAKKLGRRILTVDQRTPNLDRLGKGVPWELLVAWMVNLHGVSDSTKVRNIFSLLLDLCNDIGVSVPVTCIEDGVLFRAYRHGEDVKFSDAEIALVYEAARGFIGGSKRKHIPRIHFEKLVVLLLKIGASNNFLVPVYGSNGSEGVCRIGFDLMGARAVFQRGPRDRGDNKLWLTEYLLNRKVFKLSNGTSGQYGLGLKPEGNFVRSNAPNEAFELGHLIGMLCRTDGKGTSGSLTEQDLTLLATCATPANTANALQIELDIFRDWFESGGRKLMASIDWSSEASIERILKTLTRSHAYIALFSGCMKFRGYRTDRIARIIQDSQHLLQVLNPIFGSRWDGIWKSLIQTNKTAEISLFDPFIERAASILWDLATCISAFEISLRFRIRDKNKKNQSNLSQAFSKFDEFRRDMKAARCRESRMTANVGARFASMRSMIQNQFEFEQADVSAYAPRVVSVQDFVPQSAVQYCLQQIDRSVEDASFLIDELDPILQHHGRTGDQIKYSEMLWYDIIDSTATSANNSGRNVEVQRESSLNLKNHVNNSISRMMRAELSGAESIFCQNGNESSSNDCKHIYFSGADASRRVQSVLKMLLSASRSFSVLVRVTIARCDFAGSAVTRRPNDTEVTGDRFLEHLSRIQKNLSEMQRATSQVKSFLAIVGKNANDGSNMMFPHWNGDHNLVRSEIAGLSLDTQVRCGEISYEDLF